MIEALTYDAGPLLGVVPFVRRNHNMALCYLWGLRTANTFNPRIITQQMFFKWQMGVRFEGNIPKDSTGVSSLATVTSCINNPRRPGNQGGPLAKSDRGGIRWKFYRTFAQAEVKIVGQT